jgi:prepilin-type N-terminal cleavage/methylation domain-containing protein
MMTACNVLIRPARGFTLLEVLVAMVIMAFTLLTLLLLHSGTIRLAGAGRFTGSIPMLAEKVLADQMADPSGLTGDSSGRFDPEFQGLEWTCSIEDVTWDDTVSLSDQQLERLKKIKVEIFAPNTGRSWSMIFWRYLVAPDD